MGWARFRGRIQAVSARGRVSNQSLEQDDTEFGSQLDDGVQR